jgi:AAA15 family ATPase/GTPase
MAGRQQVPRIESLHVEKYRALRDLTLKDLTPLTVFLGPNGSGKSTLFDVFAFLSECFTQGLRKAWQLYPPALPGVQARATCLHPP